MTEIYVVMKPIPAGQNMIPSGTVVRPEGWRNMERLIQQRYLRPATPAEVVAMEAETAEKPKTKGGKHGG